jgi:hypothetical protein
MSKLPQRGLPSGAIANEALEKENLVTAAKSTVTRHEGQTTWSPFNQATPANSVSGFLEQLIEPPRTLQWRDGNAIRVWIRLIFNLNPIILIGPPAGNLGGRRSNDIRTEPQCKAIIGCRPGYDVIGTVSGRNHTGPIGRRWILRGSPLLVRDQVHIQTENRIGVPWNRGLLNYGNRNPIGAR